MGLDMYLQARKFIRTQYKGTGDEFRALPKEKMDDVFELSHMTSDVLQWRKNHWVHGFIVENFSEDGEDNCEEIHMDCEKLEELAKTLEAWAENPHYLDATEGFFFGSKDEEWKAMCRERIPEDVLAIRKALLWLEEEDFDKEWREVYYQASW